MQRYLSPYSFPLVKADYTNYYTSPYSYNQYNYQQTTKIGESVDDQRTSCKKILKVIEGITYILNNWNDFRMQTLIDTHTKDLSMYNKSTVLIRPELLFKNLLDEYIHKLLLEPLNLVLETKKNKCYEIFEIVLGNPDLLNFETRIFYFKTAAFAYSGDFNRTVHFLIQHLRKKFTSIPEQSISKQSRQKLKVIRKNLLENAIEILTSPTTIKRKNFLEIEYTNEEGTGLGPTLEFYYLCSKAFRHMTDLWRDTQDNSLFPVPFEISSEKYGKDNVVKYFEAMGWLVAKAIADDRLTDLPFSSVFWEICTGAPLSYKQIQKLDSTYGSSLNELREYAAKRKRIQNDTSIDQHIKDRQLEACCLKNNAKTEDLFLFFVIPGTEVELKPSGKDIQVTDSNLEEYLELLLKVMLNDSISPQVTAFKKGFNKVANIDYLRILKSEEIELIV